MNENITNPNNAIPSEPSVHTPVAKRQPRPLKLESIPADIRGQLDACIAKGWGAKRIKTYLLNASPNQQSFLNCSLSTYQGYINKHKDEIIQTEKLEASLRDASADPGALKDMLTSGADSTQVKGALKSLFDQCEARLRLIEIQRNKNPNDPRWESHFSAYMKERRAILETLAALNENDGQGGIAATKQAFDRLVFTMFDCVTEAHRRTYGTQRSAEFDQALKTVVKERMPTWGATLELN